MAVKLRDGSWAAFRVVHLDNLEVYLARGALRGQRPLVTLVISVEQVLAQGTPLSSTTGTRCPEARRDPDAALRAVQRWSDRKRSSMRPNHVRTAWLRLHDQGWLAPAT